MMLIFIFIQKQIKYFILILWKKYLSLFQLIMKKAISKN
jgi:hypothetical protein